MASKKIRKLTAAEIDEEEVNGLSIAEWESRFERWRVVFALILTEHPTGSVSYWWFTIIQLST